MSRTIAFLSASLIAGSMIFAGVEAWRMSRVIFAGESRPYWFCIAVAAALGPAVMAYLCGEMWNDRLARLMLAILALVLGAFCWGIERRLAAEGVEDSWQRSLALTFIATIAPIFAWLRARTQAATATTTQSHQ